MFNYTAFNNNEILAQGSLETIALAVRQKVKEDKNASILIFSDLTGRQIDIDISGTEKQVLERLKIYSSNKTPQVSAGAGRPKLGVIPREISLLPHHWEWLINQDGGSSGIIRKLIDDKIKSTSPDKVKIAQERAYKFLSAIGGNLPNFDEATRYLYRKDKEKFQELTSSWPKGIVKHSMALLGGVFE